MTRNENIYWDYFNYYRVVFLLETQGIMKTHPDDSYRLQLYAILSAPLVIFVVFWVVSL